MSGKAYGKNHDTAMLCLLTQVTLRDCQGNTALHLACKKGDPFVVRTIFRKSADDTSVLLKLLECGNCNKETPLHEACLSGHLKIVRIIMNTVKTSDETIKDTGEKLLPKLLKATNNEKKTPLHIACQEGHLEIIKIILKVTSRDMCQSILDMADNEKNLPFHLACKNNRTEVAEILIKEAHKEIIEKRSEDGLSPLHIAVKLDNLKLVQLLLEGVKVDGKPIRGSDVNLPDANNCRPLHHAARSGSGGAFSILNR